MRRDAGAWMLCSINRLQHTNTSAGGRGAQPGSLRSVADGRGAAAGPSGGHEVMCVALSAVSGARNTQLLASGAQDGTVCFACGASTLALHPSPFTLRLTLRLTRTETLSETLTRSACGAPRRVRGSTRCTPMRAG